DPECDARFAHAEQRMNCERGSTGRRLESPERHVAFVEEDERVWRAVARRGEVTPSLVDDPPKNESRCWREWPAHTDVQRALMQERPEIPPAMEERRMRDAQRVEPIGSCTGRL